MANTAHEEKSHKKAIIIISVITLILMGVWAIILVILHNGNEWLFKPYARPPLPEQKGDPQLLPNSGTNLNIGTNPGDVIHLGVPAQRTLTETDAISAQAQHESEEWARHKQTTVNSTQTSSATPSVSSSRMQTVHPAWQEVFNMR